MSDEPRTCARCHLSIAVDEDFVRAEPYTRTIVDQGPEDRAVWFPGALVTFHVGCAPMHDHRYRILV